MRSFMEKLFRTPQGIVLLLAIAAYLGCALLFGAFDIAPPFGWQTNKAIGIFIAWPILLLILFIRLNRPAFAASWSAAGRLAFYAVGPFLFMLLGMLAEA